MPEFTEAMAKVMKSWGWKFLGRTFSLDPHWYKYERGTLVAAFNDGVWEMDLLAARLVTRGPPSALEIAPSDLSGPVRDVLQGLGWRWAMARPDSGEWLRFRPNGTCDARQGDGAWSEDLSTAQAITGEDFTPEVPRINADEAWPASAKVEVWETTGEVRYLLVLYQGKLKLQQKWRLAPGDRTEWRDVPIVDEAGEPFA